MPDWIRVFKNSLRFKLLAPLTAIVIIAFIALSVVIVSVQKNQLDLLGDHIREGLDEQRTLMASDLKAMSAQVTGNMAQMTASAGSLLSINANIS